MSKDKIKVIVADDSGLMRLIISDILNADPKIEVIDTATNGKDATEKTLRLNPDVLVLDMNMGQYDGLYAVENVLKVKKIPILILSAMGNTNLDIIMDALRLGAVDYINKPDKNQTKVREIGADIILKVKSASQSNRNSFNSASKEIKLNQNEHTFSSSLNYNAIVIGSSTGGPTAVERIITKLPGNLPIPVVIAQHMPANFVPSFVNRLNTLTPLDVVLAQKGQTLQPRTIYIAPGDQNLIITGSSRYAKFDYTTKKYKAYNYPAVDALFESAAAVYGKKVIAAVLTGMGKDGADGIAPIKEAGGYTIAQNKETSVVFGMPREVIERGLATNVVSIYEMAGFMVSCLS